MTHTARAARLVARSCAATVLLAVAVAAGAPARSAGPPAGPEPAGTYRLPLDGVADVVRAFEPPPVRWAAGHRGVDLRTTVGADVVSPAAGEVTFAGVVGGRPVVTVTDRDGRRSSVEPVAPAVTVGDSVPAGAHLGTVGVEGSHCAPSACLHWGVRVGDDYVDPLGLLPGAGPAVLLPLTSDG
jgi:murein DD-endopeptidase MepM/ murein hydrolase activator NlpD